MEQLTRSHGRSYLLLSEEDREAVLQHEWKIYGRYGYVLKSSIGTGKPQPLSRFIADRMGLDHAGKGVFLANGDAHDARRENVRIIMRSRQRLEDVNSKIRLDTSLLDWLRKRPGGVEVNIRKAVEEYKAKFKES